MPMKRQKRSAVEGCTDPVGARLSGDSVQKIVIAGKPGSYCVSWRVGLACSP